MGLIYKEKSRQIIFNRPFGIKLFYTEIDFLHPCDRIKLTATIIGVNTMSLTYSPATIEDIDTEKKLRLEFFG